VRALVVHGHYYQPPREDPWLDAIEAEASAAPFHDWNVRIERECYRAVAAARVAGRHGRIARIVNALEWTSFDFGPTLLTWMEREAPATYAAVLAADAASRARLGHGNALAHPYHHVILPLASRRDKTTEVRWGIADFRRRFGREPAGMWLPETAVDDETLDVLAEHGIAFAVLAPHQIGGAPAHGLPGRYRTGGGREIAVFAYDGGLSHEVAFGAVLRDGVAWAARLAAAAPQDPGVVALATDGETYGHHHRFGEMALARMLCEVGKRRGVVLANFAAVLAAHPPAAEVTLVAPSSWSCAHGVERWRADCGCRAAPERGWNQRWRAPLRHALDWLAGELHAVYEREAVPLLGDPWSARDAYGAQLDGEGEPDRGFLASVAPRPLTDAEAVRARELLEMERDALRMFTSCAWFFDDIGGLEPLQVLRYAAHAIALSGAEAGRLDAGFGRRLVGAVSNDPEVGTGHRIYTRRARPSVPPVARVAASLAVARAVVPGWRGERAYGYDAEGAEGALRLVHRRTGRAWSFDVAVERASALQVAAVVASPGVDPLRFEVADLCEQEREAVHRALTASLASRALGAEELAALASGEADVARVFATALARASAALASDGGPSGTQLVADLLDLFALHGWPVPFDAQTAFWRWWSALPDGRARPLDPLARRFGFVAGDR
jgi:alpha-amylase/alpha-mannosidase (GH57 family)